MNLQQAIEQLGFAMIPGVLTAAESSDLIAAFGESRRAGRRDVLEQPAAARLVGSAKLIALATPHLPGRPLPVRDLLR